MMPRRLAISWFLALAATAMPASSAEERVAPVPKPELTPGQVIEIQLEALQFNDRPAKNSGIATTFQFASPSNREMTGPLERFALIVKGPAFLPLINHRIAGYGPLLVQGRLAMCRVTVVAADGQAFEYEFRLSKDPKSGCWFTDGVIPIPAKPPIDFGKVA
jgi:hypothetical protein